MGDLIIDEPEEINFGAKIYPKDIINHTLLVWAVDYIPHSPTAYNDGTDPKKPCDVVVVDVVDLDQLDPETGALGLVGRGCWWRQGKLIQRLKPRVGKPNPLLGRMGKGLGANGAFELMDLSADERSLARAKAWWQQTGGIVPSQPSQPVAPTQVSAQTNPTPPPSPLENRVNETLDRLRGAHENNPTLDRLRQLADRNQSDTPPF